jgi:hypothetical protein
MPIDDIFITEWDLDFLKKGEFIRTRGIESEEKTGRPTVVKHMRIMINRLGELYSKNKPPTKEEFNKIFEAHQKYMNDEVIGVIDSLENSEDFFRVDERVEEKNGDIIIKLKKINKDERINLIKNIAKKLVENITKEQLQVMMEEGVKKLNDIGTLEKIDKELKTSKPKITGKRGCFKLQVNDEEIMLLG